MRKKEVAKRLVVIGVRVEPAIRAALEAEATADFRTISGLVHKILHRWVESGTIKKKSAS